MVEDVRQLGNPGTPAFRVAKYPFYLLNRLVSRYNVVIEAQLRGIGIDIPTWRVLMVLGERAPRSIGDVSETAVINLSTMMRIAGRMRRDGLIELASKPTDRRVTEISLTAQGSAKLEQARAVTAPIYANVIDGLSEEDFKRLVDLLNQLFDNLSRIEE